MVHDRVSSTAPGSSRTAAAEGAPADLSPQSAIQGVSDALEFTSFKRKQA
jgi:hypothetical protein